MTFLNFYTDSPSLPPASAGLLLVGAGRLVVAKRRINVYTVQVITDADRIGIARQYDRLEDAVHYVDRLRAAANICKNIEVGGKTHLIEVDPDEIAACLDAEGSRT